ncbi:hypothetical protein HY732_04430 [Candidatus Uhrbacteria bacterium]|nr:hypothetical protein [Candidatus Uhrbacteria bacterium]
MPVCIVLVVCNIVLTAWMWSATDKQFASIQERLKPTQGSLFPGLDSGMGNDPFANTLGAPAPSANQGFLELNPQDQRPPEPMKGAGGPGFTPPEPPATPTDKKTK